MLVLLQLQVLQKEQLQVTVNATNATAEVTFDVAVTAAK
jgi:hypothetical protein